MSYPVPRWESSGFCPWPWFLHSIQFYEQHVLSQGFHFFSEAHLYSWRRRWHPTPVFLPGKSHGQRSLVGCSPWGCEESDTTERLHFHFSLSCIGEGNGNPLHCSCLENPRDRGAWWAAIYGVSQSQTQLKWLSSSSVCIPLLKKKKNQQIFSFLLPRHFVSKRFLDKLVITSLEVYCILFQRRMTTVWL